MAFIAIIVGIILLIKGGDWLMRSAVSLSFKLNIRNKSGGVYPTNIMLDYKTLNIPTKVTI